MVLTYLRPFRALILAIALTSCIARTYRLPRALPPIALEIGLSRPDSIRAEYKLAKPTVSLHFAQDLGGYRKAVWRPMDNDFLWINEGIGERVQRRDGVPFDHVTFDIPLDYRALPKSYAPFSPFSDGSALIYSGQFHACLKTPCQETSRIERGRAAGRSVPANCEATGSVIQPFFQEV
jgi:hypothetical protein